MPLMPIRLLWRQMVRGAEPGAHFLGIEVREGGLWVDIGPPRGVGAGEPASAKLTRQQCRELAHLLAQWVAANDLRQQEFNTAEVAAVMDDAEGVFE